MIKNVIAVVAVALVCAAPAAAQVDFRDISLAEAMELAGKENKLVLMDGYTSWCAPCKFMDKEILSQEGVFAFINEHFVSVRFDMEKGEGAQIAKRYSVDTYPTYLMISPKGELGYRVVGGSAKAEEFLERLRSGLEVATESSELEEMYNSGSFDVETATEYLKALMATRNYEKSREVMARLFAMLSPDEMSAPYLWFIYEDTNLSGLGTPNFDRILLNREAFGRSIGTETVDKHIAQVIERKLVDIIIGRDRTAGVEIVSAITKYLAENDVEGKDMLMKYSNFAAARILGTHDVALELLEELAPAWSDEELNQIFFSVAHSIRRNENKAQRERLVKLSRSLLERDDIDRFRMPLEQFIKSELGEKITTGAKR